VVRRKIALKKGQIWKVRGHPGFKIVMVGPVNVKYAVEDPDGTRDNRISRDLFEEMLKIRDAKLIGSPK
jgi:hypothetical protein